MSGRRSLGHLRGVGGAKGGKGDSAVTVNEESTDARNPGRAAVISTIVLVGSYVIVSVAAQAFGGTETLVENSDDVLSGLGKDVLGSPLDKLLILAVLTSAAASTETTILPTARTSLSMAFKGAAPRMFATIHHRYLTPSTSTIWMSALSIAWYVGLTIVSEDILFIGVAPLIGAVTLTWVFVQSCIEFADPEKFESGDSWLAWGHRSSSAWASCCWGVVLMLLQWRGSPEFFRRRPEVVDPSVAAWGKPVVADAVVFDD